jgi:hypothetical protein
MTKGNERKKPTNQTSPQRIFPTQPIEHMKPRLSRRDKRAVRNASFRVLCLWTGTSVKMSTLGPPASRRQGDLLKARTMFGLGAHLRRQRNEASSASTDSHFGLVSFVHKTRKILTHG